MQILQRFIPTISAIRTDKSEKGRFKEQKYVKKINLNMLKINIRLPIEKY